MGDFLISFGHPWLLAALAVLPIIWWLLRVTPPSPRVQPFPGIALLDGLVSAQVAAARTPWWLLLLRLVAAVLVIVGLAEPIRRGTPGATGDAPIVLVLDDSWAAAADWTDRIRAAVNAVSRLASPRAPVSVITTSGARDGGLAGGSVGAAGDLPARLAALRPVAWPADRAAAAAAMHDLPAAARAVYVSDGVAGAGDAAFRAALKRFVQLIELRGAAPVLLRPPVVRTSQFGLRLETLPGSAQAVRVRALTADGHALAETDAAIGADGIGTAALALPPDLRNRVGALQVSGRASAGARVLLDEGAHRRPVGLLNRDGAADTPLTGSLFYIRRALDAGAEVHEGDLRSLLAGAVSVIVIADQTINPQTASALSDWVKRGGMLVRFAGPAMAAATASGEPDSLLPVTLLAGDRALGGAMSWTQPAQLAAFPAGSPFAGLEPPAEVRIARQLLAEPQGGLPGRQDWADLTDGTPLVTAAPLGAGRLVLFAVTANATWSNLPLSGLFVDMLKRMLALSVGISSTADDTVLAPLETMDGFGALGPAGPQAQGISARAIPRTEVGARHPPGLYGPKDGPVALNVGGALPRLATMAPVEGAEMRTLDNLVADRSYGPSMLAVALLMLAVDMVVALRLRGLLGVAAAVLLTWVGSAEAAPELPSLATHLAYVITGDAQADGITKAGLHGLSDQVNQRTAAALAEPVGVDPAHDDLSFYPLLYWPILASAIAPDGDTIARLADYMVDGGIILFDTRDAASPDPEADEALRRIGQALAIPPLAQLTSMHVLSRSFYLLRQWPGRMDGAPVWVARSEERGNDGVSPVVVGANDWAAAWATDADGTPQYDVIPGGEPQRQLAYRFGINLVIYALTGNYKSDQLHVPELLRRLGQDREVPGP